MRLKRYIKEQSKEDIQDLNDKIHNDCQKYLKLIEGKIPLVRGMTGNAEIGRKRVRKNRKPQGTDEETFEKFNKWLEENGHTRRDNSLITTSDLGTANFHGDPHYIFPINILIWIYNILSKNLNWKK